MNQIATKQQMNVTALKPQGEVDEGQHLYLTFMVRGEVYGIGILAIKEILEYTEVTSVPMVPDFIQGVINVRGSVVPVIDLSRRIGQPSSEVGKRTCIVIVEVECEGEVIDIGVVVDAVNEVLDIPAQDVEAPPAFGAKIRTDFIRGMGKIDEKFVILLNVEHVLSVEELSMLDQISQGKPVAPLEEV